MKQVSVCLWVDTIGPELVNGSLVREFHDRLMRSQMVIDRKSNPRWVFLSVQK